MQVLNWRDTRVKKGRAKSASWQDENPTATEREPSPLLCPSLLLHSNIHNYNSNKTKVNAKKRITIMKVSPSNENNNRNTGRGYKDPVQSTMLLSSSLPLTAASRTRAPNNVSNENSNSTSHYEDGQTPTTTSSKNEEEGFSGFIAYAGAEDNTTKDQWQCSTCTFINKNPLHLTCDICGTVRVGQESEDNIIKEQLEEKKGMGIENCQDEEDDAPIPAAQIAARYESMEKSMDIENCQDGVDDSPIPAAQIAARYESIEKTAKKNKKLEMNEDDEDSAPLPPWQIGCEDEDLATKKSYVTSSAPPPISDCQPSPSDVVVPSSTSAGDSEQNIQTVSNHKWK